MASIYKIAYNKRSAKKYGWDPSWLGCNKYDDKLIEEIKQFQRDHDLKDDGLVGPMTFRRLNTKHEEQTETVFAGGGIICNGESIPIAWEKIKYDFLPDSCYSKPPFCRKIRKPIMIVTHWDACLSAKSCRRVLEKRGISSHFVIDNDGTIVQMADCNNVAWHAPPVNKVAIGIDFSNAVYTKYQSWYRRTCGKPRPIIDEFEVHGRKIRKPFLGFYPEQIEAYKALVDALHKHYDIPLECPMTEDGKMDTGVVSSVKRKKFKGVVSHFNVSRNKWDTAGLELDKILEELKQRKGE